MDWSKAKVILIVILLVLNTVLLINILFYKGMQGISRETIANTKVILENRNVKLECDIPRNKGKVPAIIYENRQFDKIEVVQKLAGMTDVDVDAFIQGNEVIKGEKRIALGDNNTLLYENANPSDKVNIHSIGDVEKYARRFLSGIGIKISAYKLDRESRSGEGEVNIVYIEKYGKHLIYDSYIDVIISEKGVKALKYRKRDMKKLSSNSVKVMPAYQVLLRNFNKEENVVITAMDIGFKSFAKDEEMVESQEWPKWRIVFDDGTERYFSAVNGDEFP